MTCIASLSEGGGPTHCCRLPVKGVRLGPSGHAVKRPLLVALKVASHSNKGCWIDDGQVVALRMIMLDDHHTARAVVILHVKLNAYILRKVQ